MGSLVIAASSFLEQSKGQTKRPFGRNLPTRHRRGGREFLHRRPDRRRSGGRARVYRKVYAVAEKEMSSPVLPRFARSCVLRTTHVAKGYQFGNDALVVRI
jgi:hypothetical protein